MPRMIGWIGVFNGWKWRLGFFLLLLFRVMVMVIFTKMRCVFFCLMNRGIDVVRNKIKMFAQRKVQLPPGRHKIVILDEADR